jgi:hypothetical protein
MNKKIALVLIFFAVLGFIQLHIVNDNNKLDGERSSIIDENNTFQGNFDNYIVLNCGIQE